MGDAPGITILSAAFRALDGLKATAASLDAQTFRGIEHVVADGGSNDGTVDWLKAREKGASTPTRWISEPDEGIADAMNKGVALARGDWVLVLQAEDTLAGPESLARAMAHLKDGVDVAAFDILHGSPDAPRRAGYADPARRLEWKPLAHQGIFCRRALFEEIGGFDTSLRICMDYDFLLRAKRAGARFARVPEVLSFMPDTGVSSRQDWPGLAARFAEERAVQRRHATGPAMRAVHGAYWPAYLAWRRVRALI